MSRRIAIGLVCSLTGLPAFQAIGIAAGEDSPQAAVAARVARSDGAYSARDFETLQRLVVDQQRQIDELRRNLGQQQASHSADRTAGPITPPNALLARSLSEMVAAPPAIPAGPAPVHPVIPLDKTAVVDTAPLSLRIGRTYLTPIGFFDLTGTWRSVNLGSGLGTNFGSFPYKTLGNNAANLGEFRFTAAASRVGGRVDTMFNGLRVLGYLEADLLGNQTANAVVNTGAITPRLRLGFVNVSKGKLELLAGQTWSLLTPGRKGISPIPGDVFFSQALDVFFINGLVWGRIPEVRLVYHPSRWMTASFALSNPEQYLGGSAGGPVVTLPAAISGSIVSEFDTGANNFTVPNVHPDLIAKVAFDLPTKKAVHLEVAGLERTFKTYNSVTGRHFSSAGGGYSMNANVEVVKGLRLLTNNFVSDGGGRYLFGQAPDAVVRPDGSLSLIHASSTVNGVELTTKKTLFYGYYGVIWIGQNQVIDTNGRPVGYGYAGSPNSQNRSVEEYAVGFSHTVWRDPAYGSFNVGGMYAYLTRNPWSVANGTPASAHMNQVYFNIRYTLPGAPPTLSEK